MIGNYEKVMKEPSTPLKPERPMFMVTDSNKTGLSWTSIQINETWWRDDCDRFRGSLNNPCNNTHPYMKAKFAKAQPYRLRRLQEAGCNVIMWLDGSIRLKKATIFKEVENRVRRGENFIVFEHGLREGLIIKEADSSTKVNKYINGSWLGKSQPIQNIEGQYKHYLKEGFRERWFDTQFFYSADGPPYSYKRGRSYGMYVTCMVVFDLRQPITQRFLDCWWEEIVRWSTQDQVSFPYCAWKLGIDIHALPDNETSGSINKNDWFKKEKHGHK